MTQRDAILSYLKTGRSLTPLEALDRFGCMRLGARVWELNQAGFNIKSELVDVGNGKRVAQYTLETEPEQAVMF